MIKKRAVQLFGTFAHFLRTMGISLPGNRHTRVKNLNKNGLLLPARKNQEKTEKYSPGKVRRRGDLWVHPAFRGQTWVPWTARCTLKRPH